MDNGNYILTGLQIVIILFLLYVVITLIRIIMTMKKEKRISKYSINGLSDRGLPLFDQLYLVYVSLKQDLSKKLRRIHIFDNYSKKYIKYLNTKEIVAENEMDFISTKIIFGIIVMGILVLSNVFMYTNIALYPLFLAFLIGFFLPDIYIKSKIGLKDKKIENDLLKAITIMNNAFKSGKSIMQAIEITYNELDGPIKMEFKKMHIDLTYGLGVDVVFKRFAERVPLEEVKYMTTSLTILNMTGGNIVKIFATIEKNFFSRRKLKQEKESLTATANFMYKSLAVIPFFIFLIIFIMSPDYFSPFFESLIGFVLLFIIVTLYVSYIALIRKIMKVEGI